MSRSNSINVHSNTSQLALQIWCLTKRRNGWLYSEQHSLIKNFFFSGERNLPFDTLETLDPSLLFFLLTDISCFGQYSVVI